MSDRIDQLRAMLADEPGDRFLRYAIALELKRVGKLEEALNDLESLVQEHPTHIASYYQIALLLAEAGRNAEAVAACDAGALQCVIAGDRKARGELLALKESIEDAG